MKIVKQGKYECYPAAIAQVLGVDLFWVKRLMGKAGWRNDNSGANDAMARFAVNHYGRDLVWLGSSVWVQALGAELPNSILTIDSLNYKGSYHAVSYLKDKRVIVDPNFEYPGRKYIPLEGDIEFENIKGASLVVNRVLTENEHKEISFMKGARTSYFIDYLREMDLF